MRTQLSPGIKKSWDPAKFAITGIRNPLLEIRKSSSNILVYGNPESSIKKPESGIPRISLRKTRNLFVGLLQLVLFKPYTSNLYFFIIFFF